MHRANVNDRATVEAVYPQAAFADDAAQNALAKAPVLHGVRIESEPDAEGWFGLTRARRHTGEAEAQTEALFFAAQEPHLAAARVGADQDGRAPGGPVVTPETRMAEYRAFVDRILEAARTADFQNPIGRGEERLKGFHGG